MKRIEKTELRIEYATRALVEALRAHQERNPNQCIVKSELIPHVVRRAGWIMECDDNSDLDEYAVGVPTAKFIKNRWSDICLQAAKVHRAYIVWEPRVGVRLGTFKEYQDLPNRTLAQICRGMVDNMEDRAKVIVKQGGSTIVVDIKAYLLEAGNNGDEPEPAIP